MDKLELAMLAVVTLLATAGCVATEPPSAKDPASAAPPDASADTLKTQSQAAARPTLPRVLPPEAAAPYPDFQVCLVGTRSCMALDPRPFVLCRAADAANCDRTATFVPLDTQQQASPDPR